MLVVVVSLPHPSSPFSLFGRLIPRTSFDHAISLWATVLPAALCLALIYSTAVALVSLVPFANPSYPDGVNWYFLPFNFLSLPIA